MKIGMLWFDNNPKDDLATKISRATRYYQQKYGEIPNICFAHPKTIGTIPRAGTKLITAGVEVQPSRDVLPNHFWIGVRQ